MGVSSIGVPIPKYWQAYLPPSGLFFFSAVATQCGGLIDPGNRHGPRSLIPIMLRLFSHYRIVLAVQNRDEERRWLRHLKSEAIQRVLSVEEICISWDGGPLVLVCSFAKLDICQPHNFHGVIIPDVGHLADNARWDPDVHERFRWDFQLLRDPTVPAFGFLQPNYRPSQGELLRLMAFFGQILNSPMRHRATVLVKMHRFRHAARHHVRKEEPVELMRVAVWGNDARNQFVASIAERYASSINNRVAILVENPSHARSLSVLLPEWEVFTRNSSSCVDEQRRHLIVTDLWASECDALEADVLIDARGGSHAIDLKKFPPLAISPDHSVTPYRPCNGGEPTARSCGSACSPKNEKYRAE